jgi:hypothetical protein
MRYAFVREEAKSHYVEVLCDLMDISRSGYYAWESRPESKQKQDYQRLIPKVKKYLQTVEQPMVIGVLQIR